MEDTSKPTPNQVPEGSIQLSFRDQEILAFVKDKSEYEGDDLIEKLRNFYKDKYLGPNAKEESMPKEHEWKWVMFKRFLSTLLRIVRVEGEHRTFNSVMSLIARMLELHSFSFLDDGMEEVDRGLYEMHGQLSTTKVREKDENGQMRSRFVFMDERERDEYC